MSNALFEESDLDTQPQEQQVSEQRQQEQTTQQPEQQDDLRQIVTELAKTVKTSQTPAPAAPKEMTEAEKEAYWGVWKPSTDKFLHKLLNIPDDADELTVKEKQALFREMHEGLMRQSGTVTIRLLEQLEKKLEERYAPIMEHVTQARARETREEFHKAYPALADKKYEPLLRHVAGSLAQKDFESREAFFKAVAETAAETIKGVTPDFDLGTQPKPQPKPGTAPKLPRSSVGGTGGAGGSGALKKTSRDDSDSIF